MPSPILLDTLLPLSPHSDGLHPSASAPELQERPDTGQILGDCVVVRVKKSPLQGKINSPCMAFADFYGINIPTMANSKLPMCHH